MSTMLHLLTRSLSKSEPSRRFFSCEEDWTRELDRFYQDVHIFGFCGINVTHLVEETAAFAAKSRSATAEEEGEEQEDSEATAANKTLPKGIYFLTRNKN